MTRWFRHYAGMMRDEKLVRVAVKAKQPIERVIWVWGALLESASEANDGGRYDFDSDEAAYFLRCDSADVAAILRQLEDSGRVGEGVILRWRDRQFDSDSSRERQRRYREKHNRHVTITDTERHSDGHVTSPDAQVTSQENIDREQREEKKEPNGSLPETSSGESKPKRSREKYSTDFEEFWTGYPTSQNMSKKAAHDVWKRLADEDRADAIASLKSFRAFCESKPDYQPVYADRFLKQRRWEGHLKTQEKAESRVFVEQGTPAWEAWRTFRGRPISIMEHEGKRGWWFDAELPPENAGEPPKFMVRNPEADDVQSRTRAA